MAIANCPVLGALSFSLAIMRNLEEEPGTTFSLIDPILDETGGGDISVVIARAVRLPQPCSQLGIVIS